MFLRYEYTLIYWNNNQFKSIISKFHYIIVNKKWKNLNKLKWKYNFIYYNNWYINHLLRINKIGRKFIKIINILKRTYLKLVKLLFWK